MPETLKPELDPHLVEFFDTVQKILSFRQDDIETLLSQHNKAKIMVYLSRPQSPEYTDIQITVLKENDHRRYIVKPVLYDHLSTYSVVRYQTDKSGNILDCQETKSIPMGLSINKVNDRIQEILHTPNSLLNLVVYHNQIRLENFTTHLSPLI